MDGSLAQLFRLLELLAGTEKFINMTSYFLLVTTVTISVVYASFVS